MPGVPHGCFAAFRTLADERTGATHAVMELASVHTVGAPIERTCGQFDFRSRGDDSVSKIDRMPRRKEVEERAGTSRSATYRTMRAGGFPAPGRVGLRTVRWRRESGLEAWLAPRPPTTGIKAAA